MRWGYAKAAAVAISFAIIPTAAQPQESKRWFVIETEDGKRIGHGDQTVSILPNGARVIFDETRSRTQEAKARAIRQRELTIRIQGPNGRLASITQTSWLGSAFTTISVSLTGDVATVERETGSDKRRTRLMLPADIRFDNGAALL